MSDYINEIVPVADGDADGNYPWMAIRSGSAIPSKFKNLTVVGPLNCSGYMPYNNNVYESFFIYKLNNTVSAPPDGNYSIIIPTTPAQYINEVANSTIFTNIDLNSGVILKRATVADITVRVYFEVDVVGDSAVAGDSISIGVSINNAVPTVLVTDIIPAITGVPIKFTSTRQLIMPLVINSNIRLKFLNNTSNLRGILVKNVKFMGILPPPVIP